jgi:phage antirepressor YoqD-like protein
MIEIQTENGHHTYLYTVGEVAKMLQLKDNDNKPVGRNRFFRALRYNGVLIGDNSPSQKFINMGLACLHSTTKRWKTYTVPVFTEKGIDYLRNKFEAGGYVVYVDRDEPKQGLKLDDVC